MCEKVGWGLEGAEERRERKTEDEVPHRLSHIPSSRAPSANPYFQSVPAHTSLVVNSVVSPLTDHRCDVSNSRKMLLIADICCGDYSYGGSNIWMAEDRE
ncbi:uncharacterized [Tachysurus ichikawai]